MNLVIAKAHVTGKTYRIASPGNVVGEVYLWGKFIEGPHGFRAQYAYPKSLTILDCADVALAMELQEIYGVPVELRGKGA